MDHRTVKLGKRPARHDPRTLRLGDYLLPRLPTPKPRVDYTTKVPAGQWGMMANDKIGDCTCAAAGHMIEEWTAWIMCPAAAQVQSPILSFAIMPHCPAGTLVV